MPENYVKKLRELGFEVKLTNREQGTVNWQNYGVGIYDSNRSPPIGIGVGSQYPDSSIEKAVSAAEILQRENIPYSFPREKNVEALKREISEKEALLKRLEKPREQ